MVVKSRTADTHIVDLTEVIKALNVYRWKQNPTKCIFCVSSGILLGNIISPHSIEANPKKIAAVTNMNLEKILNKIHASTYGNHVASRTLVRKAFQASFYWPSAMADVEALVRRCENCQFFGKQIHVLAQVLQTIPILWPFAC